MIRTSQPQPKQQMNLIHWFKAPENLDSDNYHYGSDDEDTKTPQVYDTLFAEILKELKESCEETEAADVRVHPTPLPFDHVEAQTHRKHKRNRKDILKVKKRSMSNVELRSKLQRSLFAAKMNVKFLKNQPLRKHENFASDESKDNDDSRNSRYGIDTMSVAMKHLMDDVPLQSYTQISTVTSIKYSQTFETQRITEEHCEVNKYLREDSLKCPVLSDVRFSDALSEKSETRKTTRSMSEPASLYQGVSDNTKSHVRSNSFETQSDDDVTSTKESLNEVFSSGSSSESKSIEIIESEEEDPFQSEDDEFFDVESKPKKKKRTSHWKKKKPEIQSCKSEQQTHKKYPRLYIFLQTILREPDKYQCIEWVDKQSNTFRIKHTSALASLWGGQKQKPNMKYEHFARTLRGYIAKGLLKKPRKKLIYQFAADQ